MFSALLHSYSTQDENEHEIIAIPDKRCRKKKITKTTSNLKSEYSLHQLSSTKTRLRKAPLFHPNLLSRRHVILMSRKQIEWLIQ